jgi:GNAT superfamily N-acetyltransferase
VLINDCRPEDVELLGLVMPSPTPQGHYLRFERQMTGQGTYLVAWLDATPVGHAEIRWDGNDVGDPFPDCPQLATLEVWPARLRSRGIGSAIIAEAEIRVRHRGLDEIGLGVADANWRAAALYQRLGFRETGCRFYDHYEVRDGERSRWISEPCRFLVKLLG